MSYPYWATPSQLGTFLLGHSFTQTPLNLIFGESENKTCVVTLLNGELPPGIIWQQNGFQVELRGLLENITSNTTFEFTFRVDNQTYKSDQTFYLSVSLPEFTSFEWVTSDAVSLGIVFNFQTYEFTIQASVIPDAEITYGVTNLTSITQGFSIDAATGIISVDLAWTPLTVYVAGRDFVFNNNTLYSCSISGASALTGGPIITGDNIVDSNYPVWAPSTYYPQNAIIQNDLGKLYVCMIGGISGFVGPAGTVNGIADGACNWNYLQQCPVWSSTVSSPVVISLDATATNQITTLTRTFQIDILQTPAAPQWITEAGLLVTQAAGTEVVFQLEAFDPDGAVLTWIQGLTWPAWLNLNNQGLLYGVLPSAMENTTYAFEVTVSDGTSSTSRSFSIQTLAGEVDFYWLTTSDLGASPDGGKSNQSVQAISLRNTSFVNYGLTGGMIPPGVMLNNETGALEGFVEYHGQDKTYYFEVTAQDSIGSIVQKFKWQIQAQNWGKFWSLSVPILGIQRLELLSLNNSNIVDDRYLYLPDDRGWGRPQVLSVPVISGIKHMNAADLKNSISNWLHNFRLTFTNLKISQLNNAAYEIVSVVVRDADSLPVWQPRVSYKKGQRVSNPQGLRYLSITSGITGLTPPSHTQDAAQDGTVQWQYDSEPLSVVDKSYPLPWYPYHYYQANSTVINQGLVYKSLSNGYSSGGPGPQGMGATIVDNQIRWQQIANSQPYQDSNMFWPANVKNIRQVLESSPGWSTAWGSGASALVNVDPSTSGISSVTIVQSGTSYWAAPILTIIGSGTGAQLEARVGVIGITLVSSSLGFTVNDLLEIDLGEGTPGRLKVLTVSSIGAVQSLSVIDSGNFDKIPQANITLAAPQGTVTVRLQAGIVQVQVIEPGSGYVFGDTQITFDGAEINPAARSTMEKFDLELPLTFVTADDAQIVSSELSGVTNTFSGEVLTVTMIKATVEGVQWQGYTRLDEDCCTFDAMSTAWVDVDSATQTTWDATATYWDNNVTVFDQPRTQWPDWSQTVFDYDQTVFDYYATMFDQRQPMYESKYSKSWFWYFGKPYDV
jgi:hypothetical protein